MSLGGQDVQQGQNLVTAFIREAQDGISRVHNSFEYLLTHRPVPIALESLYDTNRIFCFVREAREDLFYRLKDMFGDPLLLRR